MQPAVGMQPTTLFDPQRDLDLEWQLNIDPSMLHNFQHCVLQHFDVFNSPEAIQDHQRDIGSMSPSPPPLLPL